MKSIGILRERKVPADRRVAFSPQQCKLINSIYPWLKIKVESSPDRCFSDEEYRMAGIEVTNDLSDCDLIIGIKEVPADLLMDGKSYLFFSHTIKKQAHNRKLIQSALKKKITLIDYECLTDKEFNRIIGFGHYAGIVGTYNGLMGYGLKYNLFTLKPAHLCADKEELMLETRKIRLPNIKIIVTGNGRVANGSIEMMGALGIRRITPYEFTSFSFREPTYVQLHSANYNEAIDGTGWNIRDFYSHPEKYRSTFGRYTRSCDLLIHCSYWDPRAPKLFTLDDMKSKDFHISVIADVTCDIDGSIPSTKRASTIDHKFYGYNPITEHEDEAFSNHTITIMAVDNLPCELPRDASEDFGKELIEKVLPSFAGEDNDGLIERATILREGKLTKRFTYLTDFAEGRE